MRRRFAASSPRERVALILPSGQHTLFLPRQDWAVADLAHVQLQRVRRLEPLVVGQERVVGLLLFLEVDGVERGKQLEHGLGRVELQGSIGEGRLHVSPIGGRRSGLEM